MKNPAIAYAWANGVIQVTGRGKVPSGAIEITRRECSVKSLRNIVAIKARHGKGESAGLLLVPGVPEAATSSEALDALKRWRDWAFTKPEAV